jgi:hypothetical protein
MSIFLIDYENVNVEGFNGLSNCTENDYIKIFYTKGAETLTFGLHRRLSESKSKIEYYKVENGSKNALDFQLSSYLGYLISSNPNEKYYIVSKDKGYEILTNFWQKYKNLNCQISLVSDLSLKNEQEEKNKLKQSIKSALSDTNYNDLVNDIFVLIEKYKTKQGINNALVKAYESKKAGEIYKKIKPLLTDKKGA